MSPAAAAQSHCTLQSIDPFYLVIFVITCNEVFYFFISFFFLVNFEHTLSHCCCCVHYATASVPATE